MQAPSTMGPGGSANQAKLLELMRAGTLKWQRVDEDELLELRKQYKVSKKAPRRGKKVTVEEEEEEAESTDIEAEAKAKKARGTNR